jgi:hypothetical protein
MAALVAALRVCGVAPGAVHVTIWVSAEVGHQVCQGVGHGGEAAVQATTTLVQMAALSINHQQMHLYGYNSNRQ